jgi:hypothetical protein
MATCADCVHVEVCRYYINSYAEKAGIDIPNDLFESCMNGDVCEQFLARDRSAALPYPVKPGDELWYILDGLGEIDLKDYQTTGGDCAVGDEPDIVFDVSTRGFWINELGKRAAEAVSFEDCFFVSWDEIGKMYFLSREEAERALKEREKNGHGNDDLGSY